MNIKKETANKVIKKDMQEFDVQEFCRALVLSRQINGNIKYFNVENSKNELGYNGSLYSEYKTLQVLINKNRDYVFARTGSRYASLSTEDFDLIKNTIAQYESLNGEKPRASIPFNLESFLQATQEMVKGDKPIIYYNLAHSGEIGYFRSYCSDYKIMLETISERAPSSTRSNKCVADYLSAQDIKKLQELYANGFFRKKPKVKATKDAVYKERPNQIDIAKFASAFSKYLTLDKGYYTTYNLAKSKELLNYERNFGVDCAKVSALLRGVYDDYYYKLTKEDKELLTKCGFVERIITAFDVDVFINIVEYMQSVYGDDFFTNVRKCIKDYGEDNIEKEFGYARYFERDYLRVRDIMCGKERNMKRQKVSGLYDGLDKNAEICLLKMITSYNEKITMPFSIDNFIIYYQQFKKARNKFDIRQVERQYGRDIQADISLVEKALNGYVCPEYVLQELTDEKRLEVIKLLSSDNALSRLEEFFQAWDNFTEIPEPERDYRDFYEALSEDVLEYPYNFKEDYMFVANLFDMLNKDINNVEALGVLAEKGITVYKFISLAGKHNFQIERQFKRKKPAKQKNIEDEGVEA